MAFLAKLRPDVVVDVHDMTSAGLPADNFDWSQYCLLVIDSRLGKSSGLDWLRQLKGRPGFPAVVFLSSENSIDVAVAAMKLGAADFLAKRGMNPARLKQVFGELLPARLLTDMMPELRPMPDHYETQQYAAADTQILNSQEIAAASEPQPAAEPEPESIEDEAYWMEQTQILHVPK